MKPLLLRRSDSGTLSEVFLLGISELSVDGGEVSACMGVGLCSGVGIRGKIISTYVGRVGERGRRWGGWGRVSRLGGAGGRGPSPVLEVSGFSSALG